MDDASRDPHSASRGSRDASAATERRTRKGKQGAPRGSEARRSCARQSGARQSGNRRSQSSRSVKGSTISRLSSERSNEGSFAEDSVSQQGDDDESTETLGLSQRPDWLKKAWSIGNQFKAAVWGTGRRGSGSTVGSVKTILYMHSFRSYTGDSISDSDSNWSISSGEQEKRLEEFAEKPGHTKGAGNTTGAHLPRREPCKILFQLPKIAYRNIWDFVGAIPVESFDEAHVSKEQLWFLYPEAEWALLYGKSPVTVAFGLSASISSSRAADAIYTMLLRNEAIGSLFFTWPSSFGDPGATIGSMLLETEVVRSLSIWLYDTPESFSELVEGLQVNKTLTELDLTGNGGAVGKSGPALEELLGTSPSLKQLFLRDCKLVAPSVLSIARGLGSPTCPLVTLDLSANRRVGNSGPGSALVAAVAQNSRLENLILTDCKLGKSVASELAKLLLSHTSLVSLDIGGNPSCLTQDVCETFVQVIRCNTRLQCLRLGSEGIQGNQALLFANAILSSVNLRVFSCGGTGDFSVFAKVLRENSTLQSLSIRGSVPTSTGIAISVALRENKSLRFLGLSRNSLGPKFGQHLLETIRVNHSLRQVDARKNGCETLKDHMTFDELKRCKF